MFITLSDGYGHIQCFISAGNVTRLVDALRFAQGTSLTVYGEMKTVPPGQHAPDDRKLLVDYYKILGHAPTGMDTLTSRISVTQTMSWC